MFKKKDETIIKISDNGELVMKGSTPALLAMYSIITKNMYDLKGVDKDDVKLAFDTALMTDEEMAELLQKKFEKMIKEFVNSKKKAKKDNE